MTNTPNIQRGACILTAENMATEDDCTTHDHEPVNVIVTYAFVVAVDDPNDFEEIVSAVNEYLHSEPQALDGPMTIEVDA